MYNEKQAQEDQNAWGFCYLSFRTDCPNLLAVSKTQIFQLADRMKSKTARRGMPCPQAFRTLIALIRLLCLLRRWTYQWRCRSWICCAKWLGVKMKKKKNRCICCIRVTSKLKMNHTKSGGVSCKPQPSQVIVMSDVYLLLQNSVINLTNQ